MPEFVTVARLAVPFGWRVIVVSDLFLNAKRTQASASASVELARALERAEGPGARCRSRQRLRPAGAAQRRPGGRARSARGAPRSARALPGGRPQSPGHPPAWQPRSGGPLRPGGERGSRRRWFRGRALGTAASGHGRRAQTGLYRARVAIRRAQHLRRPDRSARYAARSTRRGGDPARAGRIDLALARRHRPPGRSFRPASLRGLAPHLPPHRPVAVVAPGPHRGRTSGEAARLVVFRRAEEARALLVPAARVSGSPSWPR